MPEREVVRARLGRALGFIQTVHRTSNQEVVACQLYCYVDGQTLAREVDGGRTNTQANVKAIIDGEPGAMLGNNALELLGLSEERSRRGRLVAQLNPVNAPVECEGYSADQLVRALARLGNEVELVVSCSLGRQRERFPPLV